MSHHFYCKHSQMTFLFFCLKILFCKINREIHVHYFFKARKYKHGEYPYSHHLREDNTANFSTYSYKQMQLLAFSLRYSFFYALCQILFLKNIGNRAVNKRLPAWSLPFSERRQKTNKNMSESVDQRKIKLSKGDSVRRQDEKWYCFG